MLFPVHCLVYICAEYLCRQGLALQFLSVMSNIGHSEVLTSFVTFVYKVIQMMTNAMKKCCVYETVVYEHTAPFS